MIVRIGAAEELAYSNFPDRYSKPARGAPDVSNRLRHPALQEPQEVLKAALPASGLGTRFEP